MLIQTAQIARIDGAISGTLFLIALVPAYFYEEVRMMLRTAALDHLKPSVSTMTAHRVSRHRKVTQK